MLKWKLQQRIKNCISASAVLRSTEGLILSSRKHSERVGLMAGRFGHDGIWSVKHIYTKTLWYRDHNVYVQREYENMEYVSFNTWAQVIILRHSRKHQIAQRSAAFPWSMDQRWQNTSNGPGLLNHFVVLAGSMLFFTCMWTAHFTSARYVQPGNCEAEYS